MVSRSSQIAQIQPFPRGTQTIVLLWTWLINSMLPQISKSYLFLDTVAMIQRALSLTYSKIGIDAQIFEIWNEIHSTKEKCQSLNIFPELGGLWQGLDYYKHFQADYTGDIVKFQKLIEKERNFDFLAGLNIEYDLIRLQVLGNDPFPSLEQAHVHVQQEESRRGAILYNAPVKKAGMMVNSVLSKANPSKKDHLHCDYCGKPRHTKETCWKLHRRPTKDHWANKATQSHKLICQRQLRD